MGGTRETLGVAKACLCPVPKKLLSMSSVRSTQYAPGTTSLALQTQGPDLVSTTESPPIAQHANTDDPSS